jgi:hypothetical protein
VSLRPAFCTGRITRAQALLPDSLESTVLAWTAYLDLGWTDEAGHQVERWPPVMRAVACCRAGPASP